jgi:uncharacterized protein (DUF302 family)
MAVGSYVHEEKHVNDKLVVRESKLSVADAVSKLWSFLESKNIKVFAYIDHGAAAQESGMQMADAQVVVFGDPRIGTKLMEEQPQIGIELPLKILIYDANGTKVAYREPMTYLEEFGIVQNRSIVEKMSQLMAALSKLIC